MTNFQKYNSKTDEELIELSLGNAIDKSMAQIVLDYRKYRATRLQNRLSFVLACLIGFFTIIQSIVAFLDFNNTRVKTPVSTPTITSVTVTQSPIPSSPTITSGTATQSPIPSSPTSLSTNLVSLKQPLSIVVTNDVGTNIAITLDSGTEVIIVSRDKSPSVCNAEIFLRVQTPNGMIEITEKISLQVIGETCS